jgi:hypothetical protein
VLRERPWGKPIEILGLRPDVPDYSEARGPWDKQDTKGLLYQPLWCRRLVGVGRYYPFAEELLLKARTNEGSPITLLALDDDLERRWFEFTAELPQYVNEPLKGQRGLFFGWQDIGQGKARAYFVQLDLQPVAERPHGCLVVGPATLSVRPEDAGQVVIAPLPAVNEKPPRQLALTRADRNYRVRVRARPGTVRVQVEGEQAIEFDPPFDPRGPLGIWVQRGGGRFKTATITALPGD